MHTSVVSRWWPGRFFLLALGLGALGCGEGARPEPLPDPVPPAPPAANRPPVLQKVSATRSVLDEGSSLTLSVDASDPDGQPLAYAWTQVRPFSPQGSFGPEGGTGRTWTAPLLPRDTTFTLRVTVSDGQGGSAQGSVDVAVVNVPALNQAPSVEESLSLPTTRVVAGESVPLFIASRDDDGDALTYSWKTIPEGLGTWSDPKASTPQWRSPELARATTYTLQVTVSDGIASVTRSAPLRVEVPTYARDIQPLWSPACTDCHNGNGGSSFGGLNLMAGESYASLGRPSTIAGCGFSERVQPGHPDESLLVQRISHDGCGRRMPSSDSDYFDRNPGELTRIRSWILAGARDD